MNIVLKALVGRQLGLDLADGEILSFLINLCSIPEDFLELRKVDPRSYIQGEIDQALDNFVLKYAKQEIKKCKILEDFKKLADQVNFYMEHMEYRPNFVLALNIIYQTWDDFTRAHINIKKEILKRKTIFTIYELFYKLQPGSNAWERVNKIQNKLALKYIKKEILKCKVPTDFIRLTGFDFVSTSLEDKINKAWDNFMLEYVNKEIPKCKTLIDFIKLRQKIRPYSKARDKVDTVIEKDIEQLLSNYSKIEEFRDTCNAFEDNSKIVVKIITVWSKMGQKK